jgi:putative drug exporter of the RND superfamily
LARLTHWVLRHRRLVVAAWVLLAFTGAATVGATNDRLTVQYKLPGSEGYKANEQLSTLYGNGGYADSLVPVVSLPPGVTVHEPAVMAQLKAAFAAMQTAAPTTRIASYASTGDPTFVSSDGRTTYGVIFTPFAGAKTPPENDLVRHAVAGMTVGGAPIRFTGYVDLRLNNSNESSGPGVLTMTLLGGLGALVVLAFVFASLLAFVPLVIALCSILTSFLCVLVLTSFVEMSLLVEFLIALIGLGVAIDYSLLIVVRWREERAHTADNLAAIRKTMATAGTAVVFSGTTVAIGLLAMLVLPVPFLRSVGLGGMLIPLISVLVSITLLPVILATIGPHVDWPRIRKEGVASRGWTGWARGVVRNRWLAALGAVAVLGALVAATFTITVGNPRADTLSQKGEAHDAFVALQTSGIGPGPLQPYEVVAPSPSSAVGAAAALAKLPGILGAVAPPPDSHWSRGGTAAAIAIPAFDLSSSEGRDLTNHVEDTIRALPGGVHVGGPGTVNSDFISQVYGNFPLMATVIVVVTFLLLVRAFRSLLLPLKAVLLNIVSVTAAYGIMVLIWQNGFGSDLLWGVGATHAITFWVPLMVFAFLFGLSMDYEVFILARMREEYDATHSTDDAVIRGVGRTGRLVTCAALILFLAFLSLSAGPQTDLKIMATGLAAGILLDATVVRSLLVPALVSLFGRWNWYLPDFAAGLLRVRPSHAYEPAPTHAEA